MTQVPPVRPPAVRPCDTVAIVSTSSPVAPDDLERLVAYFEHRGHPVKVGAHARAATGYVSGAAEQRAGDLMAAFTDPDVTLIVPATGGKGAAHLLGLLEYEVIRANPKVFTGMSDPSIVANAIWHRSGLLTLHGTSGYDFFQQPVHAATEAAFWDIITGDITGSQVKGSHWRIIRGSGRQISGHVVGGHLGTNRALIGTPWLPGLNAAVLILEEAFVPWVPIDQALTHLRLAGAFDHLAALVIGVPIDCSPDDTPDPDWDSLILRCVGGDFPIITNVEFGHTAHKIPLAIGGRVTLDLTSGTAPVLRYDDGLVRP